MWKLALANSEMYKKAAVIETRMTGAPKGKLSVGTGKTKCINRANSYVNLV